MLPGVSPLILDGFNRFESAIFQGPVGHFTEAELNGLPEPVKRYFRVAIAPGTSLARTARIRMRGSIKLQRWMPFRARQILNPHTGYVWRARVAWLISGADCHADGQGGMDWKMLGVKQLDRWSVGVSPVVGTVYSL